MADMVQEDGIAGDREKKPIDTRSASIKHLPKRDAEPFRVILVNRVKFGHLRQL